MKPADYHAAFLADAREAFALFESMRTEELLQLQAAHLLDQVAAVRPETVVFGAGRLALIINALARRGVRRDHATVASITCPVCQRVSYNPNDIAQKYCGFCHQFHADVSRGTSANSQKDSQT